MENQRQDWLACAAKAKDLSSAENEIKCDSNAATAVFEEIAIKRGDDQAKYYPSELTTSDLIFFLGKKRTMRAQRIIKNLLGGHRLVERLLRPYFSSHHHLSLDRHSRGYHVGYRSDPRKPLPNVALVDLVYDRDHFHGTRTPRKPHSPSRRKDFDFVSSRLATRFTFIRFANSDQTF